MKHIYTSILLCFIGSILITHGQGTQETISMGTGYGLQTWYTLDGGNNVSQSKTNWDLAFDLSGFGTSIHINSVTGTTLWVYPNGDSAAWSQVDTTGIAGWVPQYNSDTSWSLGAFDQNTNAANPFDVGWGIYNMTTHVIHGDSLFVIKLTDGSYRKLMIERMASGTYHFRYALLNGDSLTQATLVKSNFTGKNFGYYSLRTHASIDREPLADSWDLLFGQYTTFLPIPYTVTGILSNKGVAVAKATQIGDVTNYIDWNAHAFSAEINTIGYDWKTFNGSWEISDSLIYFVKTADESVWKLVFNGFGGSGTGNVDFTKEKLHTVSTENLAGQEKYSLSIYPNPAADGQLNLVYTSNTTSGKATAQISDLYGRTVLTQALTVESGLNQAVLNTSALAAGQYLVLLSIDGQLLHQLLVIQ